MEDEQGDMGQVSVLPLSGNLPNSENTEGGNQVEGSYEDGDAGEVMVEVVGSDVLVDGVSGHKESDFGSVEVGDLGGHHDWENRGQADGTQNLLVALDVSTEGDEDKVGESEAKHMELGDENGFDVAEEGELSVSEPFCVEGSDCALPSGGVGIVGDTPGTDAMDVPSLAVEFSSVQTKEVMETTSVAAASDEMTNEDESVEVSADFVKPESSDIAVEAVLHGEFDAVGKEEAFPLSENATSHTQLDSDSGMPHGITMHEYGAAPSDISPDPSHPEDVPVDDINSVVGDTSLVNTDVGQELLATRTPEDSSHGGNTEHANIDGAYDTDERKVVTSQPEKPVVNSDALVSDSQDENQVCLHEFHGMNTESNQDIGEDLHANSKSIDYAKSESIDEKSVVVERVEAAAVGRDDLQKSDDRVECLEADGDLETDMVLQNHDCSNEPTQPVDGCNATEVANDIGLNNVIEADTKENRSDKTSFSCYQDAGIVQRDSGTNENQAAIATPAVEVTDDQKTEVTQVKVLDGDGSSEGGEKFDSEMSLQSLEFQGKAEVLAHDLSTEHVDLSAKGGCPKVETVDAMVADNHSPVNSQSDFDNVVENSGLCQSKELQVSVQITETPNYGVDELDNMHITAQQITSNATVSDITQMCILPEIDEKTKLPFSNVSENSVCDLATSSDKLNVPKETDDDSIKTHDLCFMEGENLEAKLMDIDEERDSNRIYHSGMADIETGEPISEIENLKFSDEEIESLRSFPINLSGYLLPPEDGGHFSVSDLVWGKVRSHPWWPGQIFDPADASEKAVKYYKKDAYLIAYFGDQTFAWNNFSELKPFRMHFPQIEKQSSSEAFQNAVNCALQEVSRRIELGLACSCIPKDAYSEIESQVVENAGIRDESSQRYGVDWSSRATCFEPDKLLDYIRDLACHASSGADRLDLVIAQAQLSAFCRLKGYRSPSEFPSVGELLENDVDTEDISDEMVASLKRKHAPRDDSESRKERSLTELMGEREYSPDVEDELLSPGRKRKALVPLANELDKKATINAAKSSLMSQPPKPSFKIGECIRRVASQLTGSPSLVKGSNDETAIDGSPRMHEQSERRSLTFSAESFSLNELLAQLQLLAQDQKRGEIYHNNIRNFYLGFRSSIALNRRGRKKKADSAVGGSGEEFEFDDVNDSYWTDRIVHNYPEEQLLNSSENRTGNLQLASFVEEKPVKPGRKSRKRFSTMSFPMGDSEIDENANQKKQKTSPAELILNFAERNCLPSEINLNKMFRRFGPLMESETEVDHDSGRAKVIFKRGSDAEVARNSSEKFNIFGPVLVNYEIGYSPLISVKISPLTLPQSQEDMTLLL